MNALGYSSRAWIGGYEQNWVWHWVTGEAFSYSHWGPGQPDRTHGTEHYAEINYGGFSLWNDLPMSSKHHFICEWDVE